MFCIIQNGSCLKEIVLFVKSRRVIKTNLNNVALNVNDNKNVF